MSLRRPFVPPRSTRKKRLESKSQADKDVDVSSPITTGVGNEEGGDDQTPMSQWAVSDDEQDNVPITQLLRADKPEARQRAQKRQLRMGQENGETIGAD